MDKARVQQRLRGRKLAKTKIEQKKNFDRAKTQKSDIAEEFQNEGTNAICREIEVVADASSVEMVPTPPPNRKQRNGVPKASPQVLEHVSSSPSITLGRTMRTSVTLNEADEKRLLTMNTISHAREIMAFASQVFFFHPLPLDLSKLFIYSLFLIMYSTQCRFSFSHVSK